MGQVAGRWRPKVLAVGAALLTAALLAGGAHAAGTTARASVSSAGGQANDQSDTPAISANGRHVAFVSSATNLVPNTTTLFRGIFVRDMSKRTTVRLDVSATGAQGNSQSYDPFVSANGRFVAFSSASTNLLPTGDGNFVADIFLVDRDTDADGVLDEAGTSSIERVSLSQAGGAPNGWSRMPSVSADGRYVAFKSEANDLVAGDTNGVEDVFVRDRLNGTTERASVSSAEAQGTGSCSCSSASLATPHISSNGRFVAFSSDLTNLVAGDTNARSDVFVRDRSAGTTKRVSLSPAGAQRAGESGSPSISDNGRYVAFDSPAPGDVSGRNVYVRDRTANTTTQMNLTTGDVAPQTGASSWPRISPNGRFVVFTSYSPDLVGSGGTTDIVLRDRDTDKDLIMDEPGAVATTNESLTPTGGEPDGSSGDPVISKDGRYIAFDSEATNLVSGDTNAKWDIFRRDRGVQ